jgi:hypothetical protein
VHERDAELHALLVAERQRLHAVGGPRLEAEPLDPAIGGRTCRGRLHAVQLREVHELVAHPHLRVQPALLRHVAEAGAGGGVDRGAVPAHRAAVGVEHAEHDPHGGRLAGPVRADEPAHPAGRPRERHIVERDEVAEAPRQSVQLEHRGAFYPTS